MKLENKTYTFNDSENETRLDVHIGSLDLDLSRTQIQKLIKNKLITINSEPAKSSQILSPGDSIEIDLTEVSTPSLDAFQQDIPLEIIFEDNNILVINKPPGLVTHPGAGNSDGTVVNALYDKLYKNDNIRPGVVHRLDKDTSGLLVLAKTKPAYDGLAEQFKNKTAGRIYWALCFGKLKSPSGRIETKLSRNPKNRKKFSSQAEGRIAITNFKVLKEGPLSLVELALETGRTHQIRVHLAELGHPILSDPIYGSVKKINDIQDPVLKSKAKRISRLSLVAKKLTFNHPTSQEPLSFEISWPKDFEIV